MGAISTVNTIMKVVFILYRIKKAKITFRHQQ